MRVAAIKRLQVMGPGGRDALPALIQVLEDADQGEREAYAGLRAAMALAAIGPDAHPAVPALVDAVERGSAGTEPMVEGDIPHDPLRVHACDALVKIGPTSVPALIDLLANDNPHVRLRAIDALGRIGPEADSAVPQLEARLEEEDEELRGAIRKAIDRIAPGHLSD